MIEAIITLFETNMLWASAGVFVVTVALIIRSIFTRLKAAEQEDFIDVEYLMEDNDVFMPPNNDG